VATKWPAYVVPADGESTVTLAWERERGPEELCAEWLLEGFYTANESCSGWDLDPPADEHDCWRVRLYGIVGGPHYNSIVKLASTPLYAAQAAIEAWLEVGEHD
jgi:hypothetical protein